jgi:hypothetical protein
LNKRVQCQLYHPGKHGKTDPKTKPNAPCCCRVFLSPYQPL